MMIYIFFAGWIEFNYQKQSDKDLNESAEIANIFSIYRIDSKENQKV